jgi:phytoene dehydrogenase-like protein
MSNPDAIVIGSGPNGLAAAITIAREGRQVRVYEAQPTIGGGVRSAALTLPGFVHDVCSAVHPFAVASPFFRSLPLSTLGLEWIEPPSMVAHPFDDGTAAIVERSVRETAAALGEDASAYRALVGTIVDDWPRLESTILGPLSVPRHPFAAARFGFDALRSCTALARRSFAGRDARAIVAGIAAHGLLPLDVRPSAGIALVLGAMAHVVGWPFPRGGAQALTDALVGQLRSLGGEVVTNTPIDRIEDLPPSRAILCDLSPKPLLRIAGHRFPDRYRRQLERYRYGMGVFKVDWALDGPIPWTAASCARAATVHVGGTIEEVAISERDAWSGRASDRPFVILTQPSLFDATRAPAGKHTAWGYCHVPHASQVNMLDRIEGQIERFAPGFRDRVIVRAVMSPADIEHRNPNLVGGDIGAGVTDLGQLFARPTWRWYSTPVRGLYLCSASTPPGVGVHGMCGYLAAKRALRETLR